MSDTPELSTPELSTPEMNTPPPRRLGSAALVVLAVALVVGVAVLAPRWAGNDALGPGAAAGATADGQLVPAPDEDEPSTGAKTEVAVLAGGCFWGVQGVFQHVDGVLGAVSGYTGGSADTASYENVGTGRTGHAESVEVTFDPDVISYGQLLQIYFAVAHDPTELDRQGPDTGTQYRSTIFPTSTEQAEVAQAYVDQLGQARVFDAPIVTTIEPGQTFYPAEDYHQDFLEENPDDTYIVVNDLPKVEQLQTLFADRYRSQPVLVHAS